MDLYISGVLYLLGAMFMLLNFEPHPETPPLRYNLLVFFWPVMTLWFLFLELAGIEEEEE